MKIDGHMTVRGVLFRGRPKAEVIEQQRTAMLEAVQLVLRGVKERTPQGVFGAQGGLLGSIQTEVRRRSNGVIGIVGTASAYGLVVEKGRRPGQAPPPAKALMRWIEVKMGVTEEEAKKIAHPVRWKIAKKGTEGAHMFEETLDEDWPEIKAVFDRHGVAIARGLER